MAEITIVFWTTSAVVFLIGACIGSFLNVVVYRIPAGKSLLFPPSHCPQCNHRLSPTENVPIVGWLWLRGRCRHCHTPIAPRYPLVETATALLFWLVFATYQFSSYTLGYWVLVSWLLALALIDWDTMTLPGSLTRSGLILGLIFQTCLGWLYLGTLSGAIQGFMVGCVGAVVGIWLLELPGKGVSLWLGKEALGSGDPHLAALLGAWLGWLNLILAIFLAALTGTVAAAIGQLLGRLSRQQKFPFGPYLALGGALSALLGPQLWTLYFRWLGL